MAEPTEDDLALLAAEVRPERALILNFLWGVFNAYRLSGLDLSPCMRCGRAIICLPDGLPLCVECAAKEGDE